MGLFSMLNQTIIEHHGLYVEYSRTYQHVKYSPEKVSIGFIIPKEVSLPDGYLLARGIVNAQLGLPVEDLERTDELCVLVFGNKLKELAGPKRAKKPAYAYAGDEDDWSPE